MDLNDEFFDQFDHPNAGNIEQNLTQVMDAGLQAAHILRPDVPIVILKSMILSYNLRALVEVLLMADDESTPFSLDLKQLALGFLATADWIMPDFDMEATPVYPPEANGDAE